MHHKTSIGIHAYWSSLCQIRPVPLRSDIEPAVIRSLLPDLFILDSDADDGATFRLAGTRLCLLAGREMRGEPFASLWHPLARQRGQRAVEIVTASRQPIAMTLTGNLLSGRQVELELVLLPLASQEGRCDRVFGSMASLQPMTSMEDPLVSMSIDDLVFLDRASQRSVQQGGRRLAAEPMHVAASQASPLGNIVRKVLHLKVFEGGRQD